MTDLCDILYNIDMGMIVFYKDAVKKAGQLFIFFLLYSFSTALHLGFFFQSSKEWYRQGCHISRQLCSLGE